MVLLLRGVDANEHCSWCHYLSCVPTGKWSCKTEPAYCLVTKLFPPSQHTPALLHVICIYIYTHIRKYCPFKGGPFPFTNLDYFVKWIQWPNLFFYLPNAGWVLKIWMETLMLRFLPMHPFRSGGNDYASCGHVDNALLKSKSHNVQTECRV
jgi:hypothetical protein